MLSCGTVYCSVHGDSKFLVWMKSKSLAIQIKAVDSHSCATVDYAVQAGSNF